MKKLAICTVVLFAAVFCCAQQPKEEFPKQLDPQPGFAEFKGLSCRAGLPVHLSEEKCFTVDFRSCDFSKEDLSGLEKGLGGLDQKTVAAFLQFDDKTIWPKGNKMPEWLKPQEIMKIGKTPGLNIKQLHTQGITGKGVGLAIIDQGLPKHAEYQNRLVFFKNRQVLTDSLMHGAAVSSIAVGKNVGVAPEAYLYYISAIFSADENEIFDAGPISEAIEELLSLNKTLPDDKKIAVISISRGFGDRNKGRSGFLKVLEKAK
ncbi:MAG: S8 family serine peptidase, partial [Syntrophomonadaceae bacterium]|nr:S8 family serine peptidase [Syntrophomonadaceae bacterium]